MTFKNAMFSKMFLRRTTRISVAQKLLLSTLTLLPLLWSQLAFGSALSNLATSMQPGTWAALTTNGFNNGTILRSVAAGGGSSLEFADEGHWNPLNSTVMTLGASHFGTGSPQNQQVFARYVESTNTWELLSTPSSLGFDTGPAHEYEHAAINPTTGDLYHRQYYSRNVMKFSHASQTWSQCTPWGTGTFQVAGALEYFPDRNSLIFLDGDWGVWELSLASGNCTGSWVQRASTVGGGFSPQLTGVWSYHNQSRYSSLCQCVVLGGGNGSSALWRHYANGTWSRATDAPATINIPFAGSGTIFTVDPVTGYILVWSYSNANTTMYQYNPATDVWTTISRTAPMFPGPEGGVTETFAIPITTYGVIMFVSSGSSSGGQVYLYKHAAGSGSSTPPPPSDTTAPSVPGSVSAVVASSSQINVSWAASTDNVAVQGYMVYRNGTQVATVSTTAYSDTNLSPSTSYAYTIAAYDAAGNTSGQSASASATTPTPSPTSDTTAPSVPGSVSAIVASSSQINVSWAASTDNIAVQGYKVYRNGNQVATVSTTAYPDTNLSPSTSYAYTIAAYDAAGNTSGQSASASATTQSAPSGSSPSQISGSSDFQARCSQPGVVKCVGFDTQSDISGTYGDSHGILPGDSTPILDSTIKASGNSSIMFTIPSNSSANSSGSYFTNFSDNLSTQFGPNSDFYIQWRQRFSPEFLNTFYQDGGGWKQAIIGTGDKPGCSSSNAASGLCYSSCSALETVTQNTNQRGFPQMYNSCTGSTSHGPYAGFEQPFGTYDFKLQNARPTPYCLYSQGQTNPKTYFPPSGNCFGYFPNEWLTFQVHIKTGPRVNDEFTNSFVQLWVAREGQPSELVFDWGPYNLSAGSAVENQLFGKIWLLPYNTGKNSAQSHPTAYTWYDELIISTSKISDPSTTTPPPTQPPAAPSSLSLQ